MLGLDYFLFTFKIDYYSTIFYLKPILLMIFFGLSFILTGLSVLMLLKLIFYNFHSNSYKFLANFPLPESRTYNYFFHTYFLCESYPNSTPRYGVMSGDCIRHLTSSFISHFFTSGEQFGGSEYIMITPCTVKGFLTPLKILGVIAIIVSPKSPLCIHLYIRCHT